MSSRLFTALLGWVAVAVAASLFCAAAAAFDAKEKGKKAKKPSGPPPLVVDKDAPLLLDEPDESEKKKKSAKGTTGPVANNNACFVCHENYKQEPLVGWHARENTGCVDCHGKSYAHRNDENNITPPDIMYAAGKIDHACEKCHKLHDAPAREVIARWRKRCPQKTDFAKIVCTDCHGQHRLKLRSVRWDKNTGALIVRGKKKP